MTFADFLRLLRRGLWLVLALAIGGALLGYLLARIQPTLFQASATILVTATPSASAADGQSGNLLAQSRAQLLVGLVSTDSVLERAQSSLGSEYSVEGLRTSVTATAVESTNFTTISASASTPQRAVAVVEAVVDAATTVGETLDTGTATGTGTGTGRTGATQNIRITEVTPATPPDRAFSPQPRNFVAAGGAIGLALAVLLLLIRDISSKRIRGADDVNELDLGLPVAVIERSSPLSLRRQRAAAQESYRYLRSNLLRALGPRGMVAITSVTPQSSVSELGSELARAINEVGFAVLVVDARITPGSRQGRIGGAGDAGSSKALVAPQPVDGPRRRGAQKETEARLSSIRLEDFSPEAHALVKRRGWQALADGPLMAQLRSASEEFEYIVLLLPSLADSAEAAVSAASTDAAVLQIDASVTKQGEVLLALERLRGSGVREIVGAVVGAAPMDVLPSSTRGL